MRTVIALFSPRNKSHKTTPYFARPLHVSYVTRFLLSHPALFFSPPPLRMQNGTCTCSGRERSRRLTACMHVHVQGHSLRQREGKRENSRGAFPSFPLALFIRIVRIKREREREEGPHGALSIRVQTRVVCTAGQSVRACVRACAHVVYS